MSPSSRRKKVAFGLVLVAVVAGACELATRVFFAFLSGPHVLAYPIANYGSDTRILAGSAMRAFKLHYSPDPESGGPGYEKFSPYSDRSDKDEHGEPITATINRHGFRGPDWSIEKPDGVVRVVMLGASSTFGYHDRDDETYPHHLQAILDGAGARDFEVLNLGIPHMNSGELVALFEHEALALDPDVVTVYAGMNDAGAGSERVLEMREEPDRAGSLASGTLRRAGRLSLAAAFLESVLYYATIISPHNDEDVRILASRNVPRFIENLETIHTMCKARGILFIAATQQARSHSHYRVGGATVDDEAAAEMTYAEEVGKLRARIDAGKGIARRELAFVVHDTLMSAVRRWSAENQVPLADVIVALDHDRDTLLSWVHINPRGNRIVAQTFADVILEHAGDLPAPAGGRPAVLRPGEVAEAAAIESEI